MFICVVKNKNLKTSFVPQSPQPRMRKRNGCRNPMFFFLLVLLFLPCPKSEGFLAELWGVTFGVVTLQRHTAQLWRLGSVLLVLPAETHPAAWAETTTATVNSTRQQQEFDSTQRQREESVLH